MRLLAAAGMTVPQVGEIFNIRLEFIVAHFFSTRTLL
jgi:hypothetical protein